MTTSDGLVAGVLSRNYDGSATVRPPSELERAMFRLPRGRTGGPGRRSGSSRRVRQARWGPTVSRMKESRA